MNENKQYTIFIYFGGFWETLSDIQADKWNQASEPEWSCLLAHGLNSYVTMKLHNGIKKGVFFEIICAFFSRQSKKGAFGEAARGRSRQIKYKMAHDDDKLF